METHGFTNDGIPKADNTVRIDIVGGFALQKVTENRSYFRCVIPTAIAFSSLPIKHLILSGIILYQIVLVGGIL